jgi:hypothetical protein
MVSRATAAHRFRQSEGRSGSRWHRICSEFAAMDILVAYRALRSRGRRRRKQRTVSEAGYYLNPGLQVLARVSLGVSLPSPQWIRVAGDHVAPRQAEWVVRGLFPRLRDATLYIFTLYSALDVEDLERCFRLTH